VVDGSFDVGDVDGAHAVKLSMTHQHFCGTGLNCA